MTILELLLWGLCAVALLWLAYKIGKVLLRLLLGLAFLALVGYLAWRFLL